jgi:hypothetical protein
MAYMYVCMHIYMHACAGLLPRYSCASCHVCVCMHTYIHTYTGRFRGKIFLRCCASCMEALSRIFWMQIMKGFCHCWLSAGEKYINVYICIYANACSFWHACIYYIYMYAYTARTVGAGSVLVTIFSNVCLYTFMCVRIIHIYIYIYIYTHTYAYACTQGLGAAS